MNHFALNIVCVAALLAVTGCAVPPAAPAPTGADAPQKAVAPVVSRAPSVTANALQGGDWVAVAIVGVDAITAPAPRMRWAASDYVGGNAGCNNFVGKYTLADDDGALTLGPLAATRMMCVPKPQGQEDMFFKATEHTRKARFLGNELQLLDAQGQVVMRLVRANP
jgi:heat shock protein HslJ